MDESFVRTQMLFGSEALEKLKAAHVAVFGLGGVGSYVAEALARSAVGELTLVDNDEIDISNINRQLYALHSTIGKPKVDVAKARILDINPNCKINTYKMFFLPESSSTIDFSKFNYAADCIDTVTGKIEIIKKAKECNVQVISCMGTGNKSNPSLFEIADISKTSVCPLARVMRHELAKREISSVKVLYSKESICSNSNSVPASNAFTPSCAGLLIAREIITDIISIPQMNQRSAVHE